MNIKKLIFSLALGALAFASCEKPENPVEPTPKPEPEVVEPKLADPKAEAAENTVTVSGTVEDFKFIDAKKTPVGVWSSLDKGEKKAEVEGTYNAEKKLVAGTIKGLEYAKAYTVGTFVTVDGKKYYSKGAEITLKKPADPVTPVKFSDVKATAEKQTVKVSAKAADFTYVDAEKTAVGIWYSAEGKTEKTELAGTYNKETSLIEGTAENVAYGVYTFGVYANEDGKKQYSEGVKVTLEKPVPPVQPIVFSEITATVTGTKIKVTSLTANFNFVDETTNPVGMWYSTDKGVTKTEVAGKYHTDTKVISGTAQELAIGEYTVGVWATVEKGEKKYSEGVAAKVEGEAPAQVEFGTISINVNKDAVSISGRVRNLTFVDDATTPVGMWYASTKTPEKIERVKGTFTAETNAISANTTLSDGEYKIGIYAQVEGKFFDSEGIVKTISAATVNMNENTFEMTTDWKKAKLKGPGKLATFNGYQGFRMGKLNKKDKDPLTVLTLDKAEIKTTGNVTFDFYAVSYADAPKGSITLEVVNGGTIDITTIDLAVLAGTAAGEDAFSNLKVDDKTMHYTCKLTGITAESQIKVTQGTTEPVVGMWGLRLTPTK